MSVFMKRIVILLFIAFVASCAKKEPSVAWYSRGQIGLEEYKQDFLKGRTPELAKRTTLEDRKAHAEKMIGRRIKVLEAYKMGLDQDSAVVARITPLKQNLMLRRLFEAEIVDKVIPEKDIRDFYAKSGKEVIFRDILFKVDPAEGPEGEQKAREKAERVRERIRKGEDFAVLARELSEDEQTAMKGGMMGAISWTRNDDPILNALYSMQIREVSEPVRNSAGYHLLRVEAFRDKDRKPFSEARAEIKRTLNIERTRRMQQEANDFQQMLLAESDTVWSDANLEFIVNRFREGAGATRGVVLDSLTGLDPGDRKKELVRFSGGRVDIEEFSRIILRVSRSPVVPVNSVKDLKMFIQNALMYDLLLMRAGKRGLEKDDAVVSGVTDRLEEEISSLLVQKIVIDSIQTTEEDIRAFYNANLERYSEPERVKVQELMVKKKELADSLMERVRKGDDFTRLIRKYTERPGFAKHDGIIGPFPRGGWGNMGEKAFEMKPGEIAGPVDLGQNKGYSIVKLLQKTAAVPKPYEDIKNIVLRDLRSDLRIRMEAEWLEEMKKEYRVVISEEALAGAF